MALFYADDGLIENTDPKVLQSDLDVIISLFEKLGLRTNETKTKYMIVRGPAAPAALKETAYNRGRTGNGDTFFGTKENGRRMSSLWERNEARVTATAHDATASEKTGAVPLPRGRNSGTVLRGN
jgi:hypothetical protein